MNTASFLYFTGKNRVRLLCSALLVAGFSLTSTIHAATLVSVSFQGGDTVPLAAADVTGAPSYAGANWYNATGSSGGPIVLNDSTGAPSDLTLDSYSAGPFGVNGPDTGNTTEQERLFGGSLGVNFGPSTFTITGLSAFSTYDLVVYYTGGASFASARQAEITASGSLDTYYVAGNDSVYTSFIQSGSIDPGVYSSGNYVVYSGLSASSQVVTMQNSNNNMGLVGFQINGFDAVPEPSTYALLFVGGVALFILRWKRSGPIS